MASSIVGLRLSAVAGLISARPLVFRQAHEVVDDVEVIIDHISTRHNVLAVHQGRVVVCGRRVILL